MTLFDRWTQRFFQTPLLWGGLLSVAFYLLLDVSDQWVDPWLVRCLTGRWEAYLCMSLFFIGVASLSIRALDIVHQSWSLVRPVGDKPIKSDKSLSTNLGPPHPALSPEYGGEGSKSIQSPDAEQKQLAKPRATDTSYYHLRLQNALQFATRNVAPKALVDYLSDLAEADRTQMERKYELTRFLTWALPAVGSLATILGIAAAISQLTATNSAELIAGVTGGLAKAFDTFALALGLSILLMLFKFVNQQSESRLLSAVDKRVNDAMKTRLDESVDSSTVQIEQLRMLTNSVVQATEKLTQHQGAPPGRMAPQASPGSQNSAEIDEHKMETLVSRAMANALQQQSSNVIFPSGGGADLAGWKPLQQALQQVANHLARQQAKQENEGEVVQQLMSMIDDELKDDQPVRNRPELRMHVGEQAAASLWK